MSEIKQRARIEDWRLIIDLRGHAKLRGDAFGHPNRPYISEGEHILTSRVLRIDFETLQAETLNTVYDLGRALIE